MENKIIKIDLCPHCEECDCGTALYTCPHCNKKQIDSGNIWWDMNDGTTRNGENYTFTCDDCNKPITMRWDNKINEFLLIDTEEKK